MMGDLLRKEVLKAFKNLHKARKMVFQADSKALEAGRDRINKEFKQQKNIQDSNTIKNLIQYANEVARELKTTVVQAEEKQPGIFELKITPETQKLDHMPFDPNVEIPRNAWKKRKNQSCCQDK